MDYIGVKRYGADGKPSGEVRFVGLFTAEAYDAPARDVPLLRRKVAGLVARAGVAAGSHSDKRLRNILETWRERARSRRRNASLPDKSLM
jgi:glutamate dehydrogenase